MPTSKAIDVRQGVVGVFASSPLFLTSFVDAVLGVLPKGSAVTVASVHALLADGSTGAAVRARALAGASIRRALQQQQQASTKAPVGVQVAYVVRGTGPLGGQLTTLLGSNATVRAISAALQKTFPAAKVLPYLPP
jgi:hypothetical protein